MEESKSLPKRGIKLASYIASKSPVAEPGTKNILNAAWARTVEDNLNYIGCVEHGHASVHRQAEGGPEWVEKKTPTFEKL